MAHYLFNFTKASADKSKPLAGQAAPLLQVRLWGIGQKTANRGALKTGDQVLAYVGAPDRGFVGYGVLSSGVLPWSEHEAQLHPGESTEGVRFERIEIFDAPVPIESVWERMPASRRSDAPVLRRGGSDQGGGLGRCVGGSADTPVGGSTETVGGPTETSNPMEDQLFAGGGAKTQDVSR